MYRRQQNGKHQLVVQQTLIQDAIRENHDPKYVAHSGIKRTYSLISLNYRWPKMRETIKQYIRRCDPCQIRKESREMIAPLSDVRGAQNSLRSYFDGYPKTPRGNKYLLTFIDHLTVCLGVSYPRSHGRNVCESVPKPNRYTSSFRFDLDHGSRQRICHLPKNLQNIKCPQGAYFQLSCVLEWDGGKAPPFPPFRPLA